MTEQISTTPPKCACSIVIQTNNPKLLKRLEGIIVDSQKLHPFLHPSFFERFLPRPSDFKDLPCFWNAEHWGVLWDVDLDEMQIQRETENDTYTYTIRLETDRAAPIPFLKQIFEIYSQPKKENCYMHIDFYIAKQQLVGTWTCNLKDVVSFSISQTESMDSKIKEYYKNVFGF